VIKTIVFGFKSLTNLFSPGITPNYCIVIWFPWIRIPTHNSLSL